MTLIEATSLYQQIIKTQHQAFANNLIKHAIRYAQIRVSWQLSEHDERMLMDEERTRSHNAFISSCDQLSRMMLQTGEDNSWRRTLGNNRKDIGDFGCLLHAVLGIMAR